ncbi:MAG: hypothetical protein M2R45_04342 [Verrucomicrobia subdivision 3 bacterium]|nr:hypothetical protein [Limisphaerales bacterium]MCS1416046.1 hypothetical protein [Limisphaerales bacterium]
MTFGRRQLMTSDSGLIAVGWINGRWFSRNMGRVGLMFHVVAQGTENDQLLDSGGLGLRRLYYRELIVPSGSSSRVGLEFR